jgi:hypothetical protein
MLLRLFSNVVGRINGSLEARPTHYRCNLRKQVAGLPLSRA